MRARRGSYRPRAPRRLPSWLRAAGWLALILCSLFVVTWRQTRGLQVEAELRELETRREMAEAERVEHMRRIETLRSRARVVRVARDRLGMHLAVGDEIVFLPGAPAPVSPGEAAEREEGP
jgi:cell division protein FtsL